MLDQPSVHTHAWRDGQPARGCELAESCQSWNQLSASRPAMTPEPFPIRCPGTPGRCSTLPRNNAPQKTQSFQRFIFTAPKRTLHRFFIYYISLRIQCQLVHLTLHAMNRLVLGCQSTAHLESCPFASQPHHLIHFDDCQLALLCYLCCEEQGQ